jgi:hypothetical protein
MPQNTPTQQNNNKIIKFKNIISSKAGTCLLDDTERNA